MTATLVLGAAVLSALAYSAVDVARKVLVQRVRATPLLCYFSLGTVPFFVVWWKAAAAVDVGGGYWLPGAISVVLNILSNLLFFEAVRKSPLSVTIPMLSLTPVFTTILGIPLLGEVPTSVQSLGILLVVAGAFVINLSGDDRLSPGAAWRALRREPGSLMMAAVALLWSIAAPLDKLAMTHASPAFHGLVLNFGVGAGALVMLAMRRRLGELLLPKGTRWGSFLAVLGSAAAIGLYLLAIQELWVGLVESLKRAIGSSSALVIGRLFFREDIRRLQIAAVLLMTIGVALVLS